MFFIITIFRLAIPAFLRFTDVTLWNIAEKKKDNKKSPEWLNLLKGLLKKQSKQNETKSKLRISIIFIFRHCFMLSFPPYLILLITLNLCTLLSLQDFFLRISACRIFLDKFPGLQEFLFGNCHPTSDYFWWSVPYLVFS